MTRIQSALQELRKLPWLHAPWLGAAEAYVATGDRDQLARVAPDAQPWPFRPLAAAIALPPGWGEEDRRALHVLAAARLFDVVAPWAERALAREDDAEDRFGDVRAELAAAGLDDAAVAEVAIQCGESLLRRGRPTSAGRFLATLDDGPLRAAIAAAIEGLGTDRNLPHLLALLLAAAPGRVSGLLPSLLAGHRFSGPLLRMCELLVDSGRHEADVAAAFRAEEHEHHRFEIGAILDRRAPDRYGRAALEAARASLAGEPDRNHHANVARWLLSRFPEETIGDVAAYVSREGYEFWQRGALQAAVEVLGARATPILLAALERGPAPIRLEALARLVDLGAEPAAVHAGIVAGLESAEPAALIRVLGLAARVGVPAVAEQTWPLLAHASKPVRDAAARALGRLGEPAVAPALERLGARKAPVRAAAVTVLATAATPSALAALEARLDVEEDEGVRDAIYRALGDAWKAAGREFTAADLEKRIARAEKHLAAPPAKWLDVSRAPAPRDADGRALSEREVRYLVYRQSRAKDLAPDVEAAPLLARVRGRGPELAAEVLRQYLASGADAGDRWALALAALLGDDRIVPVLAPAVREWADGGRGKLAEYGVQALALLGTDQALVAVDALALRYRVKNKNVGRAAVEAFAAAAEARGVTPDELGDRVVPRLGFPEGGGPRVVEAGKKTIEVSIGVDLKLAFREAGTGKRVASVPKAAGDEVRAELKELAASLKEIAKAQVLRLENLMVRQRRWPAAEWRSLFLEHPVLFPFAVRLVWATYGADGARGATFRALEDHTLTDAAEGAVAVPRDGLVGAVHPLELSEEERQAWLGALADHEVAPPFPQLDRPVVKVAPEARDARSHRALAGTSLNALTFRGRAEKLGWHRGSVVDGGGITSYRKTFPAAGAEAFLELDGLFMGAGMDASVTLGPLRFVKGGTVTVGSYEYDEPAKDEDPRVLAFGEVPPIVFSEVMGDLERIAGTAAGGEEEA